jgi:hypothetical protein
LQREIKEGKKTLNRLHCCRLYVTIFDLCCAIVCEEEKEEKETLVLIFKTWWQLCSFGSMACRSLFCLFWVMCLVCYQNSVCVCGYIQLI